MFAAFVLAFMAMLTAGTLASRATPQSGVDVDGLVTRFLATAAQYEETFQNLTAEETKNIEMFKASGEVDKRREIVSDLVVYRSSHQGTNATAEYRDVRLVDGKAIDRRGERALKLLTKASKSDSLDKELEAINRETSKYEFHRQIGGYTIEQGGELGSGVRPFVEWVGRDQVAEHEVVVLDYQADGADSQLCGVPKEFDRCPIKRPALARQAGRLWRCV